MKKIKNVVSLLLVVCLILNLGMPTFASENTLTTLVNNENVIVVREITSEGITIATNDKNTNILTVEKYDSSGKVLISSQVINLATVVDNLHQANSTAVQPLFFGNGDVYQHTFCNYEYDIWYRNPNNKWKIRKPQNNTEIYLEENPSNTDNLYVYAERVEDVNRAEFDIIFSIGETTAVIAIAVFLQAGIAAAIAAAGGGFTIVRAFENLESCCNKALLAFNRI